VFFCIKYQFAITKSKSLINIFFGNYFNIYNVKYVQQKIMNLKENKMKKILLLLLVGLLAVGAIGCSNSQETGNDGVEVEKEPSVEGTLEEIMERLYSGVEIQLPKTMHTVIEGDNIAYFLGSDEIIFTEGLASEPMISSAAHSIALLRVDEDADIDVLMNTIKTNVDPRKWICVGVEEDEVIVDHIGNLIILVMDQEAEAFHESFLNLAE
jgi:hypothetical protein